MDDIALHGHPAAIDLFAYLDGEVEASARTAIEAHLRDCPECAARLRSSSAWVSRIDSLPDVSLGRDLSPGVMRRIRGRGRFSPGILLLAAFQVAVAVALLWLLRDDIAGRLSQTAAQPWLEFDGCRAACLPVAGCRDRGPIAPDPADGLGSGSAAGSPPAKSPDRRTASTLDGDAGGPGGQRAGSGSGAAQTHAGAGTHVRPSGRVGRRESGNEGEAMNEPLIVLMLIVVISACLVALFVLVQGLFPRHVAWTSRAAQ